MARKYRIELDKYDLGQFLNGLEIRVGSWGSNAKYLRAGDMSNGELFMIEECSDEDEAEGMAATYGRIIGKLVAQRDSQAVASSGGAESVPHE
jgi:hypothetical protein